MFFDDAVSQFQSPPILTLKNNESGLDKCSTTQHLIKNLILYKT